MEPVSRSNRSLLVVDDEAPILQATSAQLDACGYLVETASSAEEGLEMIRNARFSCVLTDLRMPGMDGHALISQCRKIDPELPVIVMSGQGDIHDVIECLRAGVSDYLIKPFSREDLATVVQRAIALRESRARGSEPAEPLDGAATPETPATAWWNAEHAGSGQRSAATISPRVMLTTLVEQIRAGEAMLPSSAAIALDVRSLVSGGQCSPSVLKKVVERDVGLSHRVVKLAGESASRGLRVNDLGAAVTRIGAQELPFLLEALSAREYYTVHSALFGQEARDLWQHSLARAVAMRHLAHHAGTLGVPQERAYLAGLFCDAGAPYLMRVLERLAPAMGKMELLSLVADHHSIVGGMVVQSWKLPPHCFDATRHHHDAVARSAPPILRLTWAAEAVCSEIGFRGDPGPAIAGDDALARLLPDQARRRSVALQVESFLGAYPVLLEPEPEAEGNDLASGEPPNDGGATSGVTRIDSGESGSEAPRRRGFSKILARIRAGEMILPAIAEIATEVRRYVTSERESAADLKDIVERDSHLVGRIIQMSNNARFASASKVTDLRSALTRIGLREVSQIVDTVFAHDFYSVRDPRAQELVRQMWRHSWTRAVAMRCIASASSQAYFPPERAYLAGLFCDAGAPYLYKVVTDAGVATDVEALTGWVAEQHAQVGIAVCRILKLPPECAEVAGAHHLAARLADCSPAIRLVWAAEPICERLNIAGDPLPISQGEEALIQLVPGRDKRESLRAAVAEFIEQNDFGFEDLIGE